MEIIMSIPKDILDILKKILIHDAELRPDIDTLYD